MRSKHTHLVHGQAGIILSPLENRFNNEEISNQVLENIKGKAELNYATNI
jgi:hypothetical protein